MDVRAAIPAPPGIGGADEEIVYHGAAGALLTSVKSRCQVASVKGRIGPACRGIRTHPRRFR